MNGANRTVKPIPQSLGNTLSTYSRQLRQTRAAVLGDGYSSVAVPPNPDNNGTEHYGRFWIRLAIANDNGGNTQYGEPQKARLREFLHFEERQGLPLRVYQDSRNGEWVIDSIDTEKLVASNVNPSSYNFFRVLNSLFARMLRDGKIFVANQVGSLGTKFSVESYVGLWDGDRQFYEHARGLSSNLDLSSYIPSSGNERLVLVAYLPYENSYQIVSGASRAIVATNFDLSYLNDMAEQLYDYAMPKGCFHLKNAQTTVTIEDFTIDLRQWFLAQRPRGFPKTISYHTTICTDYEQVVYNSLTVVNTLNLDGSLVIL